MAYQLLQLTSVQEELKRLLEKDKKKREGKKERYLQELEKLALSDITKYKLKFKKIKYENGDIDLEFKVIPDEKADPITCATAAIKEISQGKYGPKIKTHGKEVPLLKLIDREDKIDALIGEKENKTNGNLSEVLKQSVSGDWARWKEENENSDTTV